MRSFHNAVILILVCGAFFISDKLRSNPLSDATYVAVGLTPDNVTRLPGGIILHAGDTFYAQRRLVFSRYACVTLSHIYNNEFGPIRVADTHFCHDKGAFLRQVAITVPATLPPQLWTYTTSEKWSPFYEPEPLPDFRICVIEPEQVGDPTKPCPTKGKLVN
jgi:hypothetical protein